MLTFVLTLAPLIWLLSLIERKAPHVSVWNNRQERLQFEREVDNWRYSSLMELP